MAYLDAASTEPLHPAARDALLEAIDGGWADPARLYRDGRRARQRLDAARETVAAALGARPDEVAFTASGTQAVQLGVLGVLKGRARTGRHLVASAVEHSAVLHTADAHVAAGGTSSLVGVDGTGRVDAAEFAAALRPDTALACLQSANHEVGTLQPVAEAVAAAAERRIPLLVDAAQSAGRLPVPPGWSVLVASAHKWGGPAGVGVLATRRAARWRSPLPGGEREGGRAPGFENIPAIAGAAAALAARAATAEVDNARLHGLVERVRAAVPAVPDTVVIGDPVRRLPHLVTFSCLYVDGETLVTELDRAGFAVSSGSSCTASTLRPSHVLEAMGVLSSGNVRVSLPLGTAAQDVEAFLAALPGALARARAGAVTGADVPAAPATTAAPDLGPLGVAALTLDVLGRRCPAPVIALARRIREVGVGEQVAVLADDAAANLDIPAWCQMRGQVFVGSAPAGRGRAYVVRRIR